SPGETLSDVLVFTLRLRAAAGPRSRGSAGLDSGLLRALLEEGLFPTGRSPARKVPDFSADFAQEFSDARMGARPGGSPWRRTSSHFVGPDLGGRSLRTGACFGGTDSRQSFRAALGVDALAAGAAPPA